MRNLRTRLARIAKSAAVPWTVEEHSIKVELWEGGRQQRVEFGGQEGDIRLSSIVSRSADVTRTNQHWRDLACRIWHRNATTQLVGFAFDDHDCLVGFVEHEGKALSDADLRLYVDSVARECDHLEYLLSGEDRE